MSTTPSINQQISQKLFNFKKNESKSGSALSPGEVKELRKMLETEAQKHDGKIPYSLRDTFDSAAQNGNALNFKNDETNKEFTELVKWMNSHLYDPLNPSCSVPKTGKE